MFMLIEQICQMSGVLVCENVFSVDVSEVGDTNHLSEGEIVTRERIFCDAIRYRIKA